MRHRFQVAFVFASLLLLVMAGCRVEPTPVPTPAPAPALTPAKPSGVLRVALSELGRETFDPTQDTWMGTQISGAAMYDFLLTTSPDAKLIGGIAEKWEMAPDGLSWIFKIRKGVKFHNGDPVTAPDAEFSLTRYMNKAAQSPYAGSLRANIKSIKVVDDYTVQVYTNGVMPYFPNTLALFQGAEGAVMPKNYIIKGAGEDYKAQTDFMNKAPVGSGPWKFVKRKQGDSIEFEAVEGHWRQTPAFKSLIIYNVPEEATRVAMLKTGAIDVTEISPDRIAEVKAVPGLQIRPVSDAQNPAVVFYGTDLPGSKDLPTSNPKVRQALSLAINRAEIIQYILLGQGTPTLPWGISRSAVDIDLPYWEAYSKEAYRYDLNKAKQLLVEAGYPDGFSLKIYTYPYTGHPWLPKLAETVGAYWSKVGVKAEIIPIDYAALRTMFQARPIDPKLLGNASTQHVGVTRFSIPAMGIAGKFYSSDVARLFGNPELDKLIDGAFGEPNEAKRREMTKQMVQWTADSYVALPIAYGDTLYVVSANIGKWQTVKGFKGLAEVYATIQHP